MRVVFWVPKGSHTIGDLLVHLPDDKVLVAGDVLVNRVVPTLQDGFVKNWIQTLDEMQTLGVEHFVPGHGDLMTLRDVAALRGAMLRFYAGVNEGFKSGKNESEIRQSLDLSAGTSSNARTSSDETSIARTWRSSATALTKDRRND